VNVWRGQMYLAMAVAFSIGAVFNGFLGFVAGEGWNGSAKILLYVFAGFCVIGALTCAAMSYAMWVPRWERDKRLAGKVPGERRTE
jgi:hypothetical protein